MEIRIQLPAGRFVLGEDVRLHVIVTNDDASAIEVPHPFRNVNWQPVYTIVGPAYPNGFTFSFRSQVHGDPRPDPPGVAPMLISLGPGESVEGDLNLRSLLPLQEPGSYEVTAQMDWQEQTARSAPVRFVLEPLSVVSSAIGVNVGVESAREVRAAWLHQDPEGRRLYQALFLEARPDLAEFKTRTVAPVREVAPNAVDIMVPWTNFDRTEGLITWHAWRTEATLYALPTLATEPQTLTLDAPPAYLVRPALMPPSQDLHVFAISAPQPHHLLLLRFARPERDGQADPPRILWQIPVPVFPQTARSALAPRESDSDLRIVLAEQLQDDAMVYYGNARASSPPSVLENIRIPGAFLLPSTEPGIYVDPMGTTHAAVLVMTDREQRRFAVVDMTFGPDGKPGGSSEITDIGALAGQVKAAAIGYSVVPAQTIRREWAILLESGEVIHSLAPHRPRRLNAPPAEPLELLVLSQATYLLTLDGRAGPGFTPLY